MVCLGHGWKKNAVYAFDEHNSAVFCRKCKNVYSIDMEEKPKDNWSGDPGLLSYPFERKEVPNLMQYLGQTGAKISAKTKMDDFTRRQVNPTGLLS